MAYTFKQCIKRFIINVYHALLMDKLLVYCGFNRDKIISAINKFYPGCKQDNIRMLTNDIKSCYYKYLTTPDEYFLFGFNTNAEASYRESFLTDNFKVRNLLRTVSERKYVDELCNKYNFAKIAYKYFNRGVTFVGPNTSYQDFADFTSRCKDLFIKPVSDSFGRGARTVLITSTNDSLQLFEELNNSEWIVEERISQCSETSMWNESSVNTVRLPCFLSNGHFHVLAPFFRTGRKGSVVDNAGGGGIFACIDAKTGVLNSDGVDEMNNYYTNHPDSDMVFRGWQIPRWNELLTLAEETFRECFPTHRYIGFDYALTENGWVLIEGNWGQFVGQYNSKKGVKQEFINYLNA